MVQELRQIRAGASPREFTQLCPICPIPLIPNRRYTVGRLEAFMQIVQPVTKRHELKVQELRDERRKEQQHLDALKSSLQHRIEAKPETVASTIRVA